MQIEIDPSAANDTVAHRYLFQILAKIDDGWHVWQTALESDLIAIKTSTWITRNGDQGKRVRELLEQSVKRSFWVSSNGRCVRVTTQPNSTEADELMPRDAAKLAEEQLVILVENRRSDGNFVKRIVELLDPSLHKYWTQEGNPIRFDSLGGKGEMANHVRGQANAKSYRPRLVTIIDSDRENSEAEASSEAKRLLSVCQGQQIPCWILAKREAENYLPKILLENLETRCEDHANMIQQWDTLSDDHKDFCDMKQHFHNRKLDRCWTLENVKNAEDVKVELVSRSRGDLERGISLIKEAV